MIKTVITYGTFDILHAGHVRLLKRARELGDRLIVGVSTDEFNASKDKRSLFTFDQRAEIISALKFVDGVIPESSWEQKRSDILQYSADIFVIGDDWKGKFDDLSDLAEVVYLPRTPFVSTTEVKASLSGFSKKQVDALKDAIEVVATIVKDLS